ncbi:zinc-binding dehydrogenase [uncultured Jatrophihabitans sp.]|uniref:zinc-dependent alcohol dehydrogenase n=1 Tax=uncultured Jatrophihabitans sp. TaxID=1610747 RepID=UPI0035CA755C
MSAVESMRAGRWHGAGDVRIERVGRPKPVGGQILVAVERVGLCGTDLEEFARGPVDIPPHLRTGVTLGHEVTGRVVECPAGEVAVGTRVIPDVVRACGHCEWCRRHEPGLCDDLVVLGLQADGGLAEFMLADATTCIPVSESVPLDSAVFAEPLSVAVRAIRKCGDLSGADVAVIGLGTIGNLAVQVAALHGVRTLIGIDPVATRRAQAGASIALHPGEVSGYLAGARRPDVVIECAGTSASVVDALGLATRGGTVVVIGTGAARMTLPMRAMVLTEKRLLGSAAHVWDVDVQAAVALLERSLIDPLPLVDRVIELEAVVDDGFAPMERDSTMGKVLIDPQT